MTGLSFCPIQIQCWIFFKSV